MEGDKSAAEKLPEGKTVKDDKAGNSVTPALSDKASELKKELEALLSALCVCQVKRPPEDIIESSATVGIKCDKIKGGICKRYAPEKAIDWNAQAKRWSPQTDRLCRVRCP